MRCRLNHNGSKLEKIFIIITRFDVFYVNFEG